MFTEDFSAFFNPDEFAVTATLAGVQCTGIFDNDYTLGNVGSVGMAGTTPTWTVPTASIPPHVREWLYSFEQPINPADLIVLINAVSYRVVAHEPDGTGVSRLLMELV